MKQKIWMPLLLLLFFATVSFGQLEKFTIYSSISIYLHEILMAVFLILMGFSEPKILREIISSLSKIGLPIKLFIIWTIVGWLAAAVTNGNLINPVLYSTRILFYLTFLYALWRLSKNNTLRSKTLKIGMITSGFYILYFGLLQYVVLPDTRFLSLIGWDDHYFRLISTILDPGFTGIIFILNMFLLMQTWFQRQLIKIQVSRQFTQAILGLLLTTLTIGISLTYSRATYLAFGMSGLLTAGYFFSQNRRKISYLLLGCICLLAISIPLLPRPDGEGVKLERTSTIVSRSTSAQNELTQLHSWQWLTGKGLFVSAENQLLNPDAGHNRVPDNWLVMLLSGTGVVGTVLFLFILTQQLLKTGLKHPWLWAGIGAVLIHGLFNASLIYPFVLLWLGFLALPKTSITVRNE